MKLLSVPLALALAALAIPSASAQPELPGAQCTSYPWSPGGDTHCEGQAGPCDVLVHAYDVEDALNRYQVDCAGCWVHYGGGPLAGCDVLATQSAAPAVPASCQDGIAQTWCDVSADPCHVRVVPWTAWGDVYAWADCDGPNLMRCYAEAHVQDPLHPEQWCAF